jgi:hypothetical protein
MSAYKGDTRAIEMTRLRDSGLSYSEIGRRFGVDKGTAHGVVKRWRSLRGAPDPTPPAAVEQVSIADGPEGRVVDSPASSRIRSLDALLAAAQVDLERWRVDRHVIKWEVAASDGDGGMTVQDLWQVKAWLSPLVDLIDVRAAIAAAVDDMRAHSPRYDRVLYPEQAQGGGHLLELGLYDHHLGMLSWGEETGADYDSDIAETLALDAVSRLLGRAAGFPIERVLLTLGHDWMHADTTIGGAGAATTRGTSLDADTRWPKMFRRACRVAVAIVDQLRLVAPVEVVIVPGNHDSERAFMLGEVLSAHYRLDDSVTIRNDPAPRTYVLWGNVLLGLAHADGEKPGDLAQIMATEAPNEWAASAGGWREWHVGHLHRKREGLSWQVEEDRGVRVRWMPTLAPRDAWAAGKGYLHLRAAEAYLWHRTDGYVGTFSVSVPDEYRANVAA